jgi:DNA adenine methylase
VGAQAACGRLAVEPSLGRCAPLAAPLATAESIVPPARENPGMTRTTYNGGKHGAGVYQRIINQQPPHTGYVEPFLGFGAVLRRKRPAAWSWASDLDASTLARWQTWAPSIPGLKLCNVSAFVVLPGFLADASALVYIDPPYHPDTRKDLQLYKHELTAEDHEELLQLLTSPAALVQISGRRCELYDDMLSGWRRLDFEVMTRRGMAAESLWMNYPEPRVLHTIDYAGRDYRERERIKRLRSRWAARFAAMSPLEQQAVAEALTAAGTVALSLTMVAGAPGSIAGPGAARATPAALVTDRASTSPPADAVPAGTAPAVGASRK